MIRYALDHSGASVRDDARVLASIESDPVKRATEKPSANSSATTTPLPATSASRTESSQPAEGINKEASPAASVRVTAIRVEQGLFTDIRVRDNVICAADYPFLGIGEAGGEFVALNGIARQSASDNYLSVYRGNKWIAVKDRGVDPLNLGFAEADRLVRTANDLCPSPSSDIVGEAARKMKEGEARLVQLGSTFGLGSVSRPRPTSEPRKAPDDDATEVVAWHLTQGLAREAQVGQKIRTAGGMACFRFDEDEYRCVKFDRTHGRTAILAAANIDGPEKQTVDEHCFTLARSLNDRRCDFNVTMVVKQRGMDHLERTFIYSSDNMKLKHWSKY
ncbi:hypothetical protein RAD16_25685 [Bradyrhizobium sp. 18BD]